MGDNSLIHEECLTQVGRVLDINTAKISADERNIKIELILNNGAWKNGALNMTLINMKGDMKQQVVSLIESLLYQSGDIETNPGPLDFDILTKTVIPGIANVPKIVPRPDEQAKMVINAIKGEGDIKQDFIESVSRKLYPALMRYGEYGGKYWTGGKICIGGNCDFTKEPVDALDALYRVHDKMYSEAGNSIKKLNDADEILIQSIDNMDTTNLSNIGKIHAQGAKMIFTVLPKLRNVVSEVGSQINAVVSGADEFGRELPFVEEEKVDVSVKDDE